MMLADLSRVASFAAAVTRYHLYLNICLAKNHGIWSYIAAVYFGLKVGQLTVVHDMTFEFFQI